MRKLLKYLRNYKKECVLAPVFKALEAGFELLVPLVIAHMIDVGIPQDNGKLIVKCGCLLLLLALVGFASAVIAQFFAAKAAVGFSTEVRHDLFSKLLHLSFSQIDDVGSSTMITRLTSDVTSVQSGVNMILRLFLRSPYIVIGATIMAFLIDFRAGALFVLLIVILFLIVSLLAYSNIALLQKAQEKLDKLTGAIRENLSGVRVIRAFCRQEDQIRSFDEKNKNLFVAQKEASVRSALLNPVTYVIINLFIVWLIRIGAIEVENARLTGGSVIALYNYMSQILIELIKFASLLITINKAMSGGKRIAEILEMPTVGFDPAGIGKADTDHVMQSEAAVAFSHVSLRYHEGADEVLSDIDFQVRPKEMVGIIGSTGAGKTSLAHLITGFYPATAGKVMVNGRDIREFSAKERNDLIAIVMQKSVLFSGTIADNLRWGNDAASDEELMEAVRLACCEEVVTEHGGLDATVQQGGMNYSGGQKQRLCIARALLKKPQILIMDDSSSALDYVTDRKLRANLRNLPGDMTVFLISQRTVSIRDCDHIIVLDDGKMVGYGTHEELLASCEVYAQIHQSQGGTTESEGGVA